MRTWQAIVSIGLAAIGGFSAGQHRSDSPSLAVALPNSKNSAHIDPPLMPALSKSEVVTEGQTSEQINSGQWYPEQNVAIHEVAHLLTLDQRNQLLSEFVGAINRGELDPHMPLPPI